MIRVALISASGTGRKRTLPALKGSSVCEVVAVHGREAAKLEALAEEFGVPGIYTDLATMIKDRDFDVAMVCSPPFLHGEQAGALLDAGVPTLVEKPLALTREIAADLASRATATGATLGIAHHLRHSPTFHAIRDAVAGGRLGTIDAATMEWSFRLNHAAPSSVWKLNPDLNGLTPFSDAGVHCLDIGIGLFGPGQIVGAGGSGPTSFGGTWESCDAIARHGPVRVAYRASRIHGPFSNQLTISGDAGELVARGFFGERPATEFEIVTADGAEVVRVADLNAYRLEVEEFALHATQPGSPSPGTTPDAAVSACAMVDQISSLLQNQH